MSKRKNNQGIIYALYLPIEHQIKIGCTLGNLWQRLQQIKFENNSSTINLLGVIDVLDCCWDKERKIHQDLYPFRVKGREWYKPTRKVKQYVQDNFISLEEYEMQWAERIRTTYLKA